VKLYRGVVEYNNDPEKIGRVKVRIFGIHTKNNEYSSDEFNFIRTEDLPWSEVMGGNQFGLISGVGLSSILKQGTWVWVILDHDDPNKPVIIGTIIGINIEKLNYKNGSGFCDAGLNPNDTYPKEEYVGKSDIHKDALDDYPDTDIIEHISGTKITMHKNGDVTFDVKGNFTINADNIHLNP
jgi:hypothetical protein